MRIVYSREAVQDLVRLREFIAVENPAAAQRIAAQLRQKIEGLRDFPDQGVEVGRAPDPLRMRDLIVGRYVARYLRIEKAIFILRVWHHREDRPPR